MKSKEFLKILEESLKRTRATLEEKGALYATEKDRLWNFKQASRTWNHTPEHCLYGMVLKHWVRFTDMVEAIETQGLIPTREQVRETTGDIRLYMHLFEALVEERLREGE